MRDLVDILADYLDASSDFVNAIPDEAIDASDEATEALLKMGQLAIEILRAARGLRE